MPQCSKDFLKELTINFAIVIIQFSFFLYLQKFRIGNVFVH